MWHSEFNSGLWFGKTASQAHTFYFSSSSFWKSWTEVTNVASEHGVENSYTASGSAKELSLFSLSLKTLLFFLMTQMIRWTRRHFFVFTYANSILYRTSHPLQLLIPQEAKTACQAELVGRNGEHSHQRFLFLVPLAPGQASFPPSLPPGITSLLPKPVLKPLFLWAVPGTAAHAEPSF